MRRSLRAKSGRSLRELSGAIVVAVGGHAVDTAGGGIAVCCILPGAWGIYPALHIGVPSRSQSVVPEGASLDNYGSVGGRCLRWVRVANPYVSCFVVPGEGLCH